MFRGTAEIHVTLGKRARAVAHHVEFLRSKGMPYDRMDGQGRTSRFALGRNVDRLAKRYLSRRPPPAACRPPSTLWVGA